MKGRRWKHKGERVAGDKKIKVTDVEKRRSHTDLGNMKRLPFGKWEYQSRT